MGFIDCAQDAFQASISLGSNPLYEEADKAVWNALDDQERLAIIAADKRFVQITEEERAEDNRRYQLMKAQEAEEMASLGYSMD